MSTDNAKLNNPDAPYFRDGPKWKKIKQSEYDRLLAAANSAAEVKRVEREAARAVVEQITMAATQEIAHLENRIFDLEKELAYYGKPDFRDEAEPRPVYPY